MREPPREEFRDEDGLDARYNDESQYRELQSNDG
jgi:hypothetical protein